MLSHGRGRSKLTLDRHLREHKQFSEIGGADAAWLKAKHHINSEEVTSLIRELALVCEDSAIVSILNRLGYRTGNGNTWTEKRVQHVRHTKGFPACPPRGGRMKLPKICHHEVPTPLGVDDGAFIREGAFRSTGFHQGQHLEQSRAELERNGGPEGVIRRRERGGGQ